MEEMLPSTWGEVYHDSRDPETDPLQLGVDAAPLLDVSGLQLPRQTEPGQIHHFLDTTLRRDSYLLIWTLQMAHRSRLLSLARARGW